MQGRFMSDHPTASPYGRFAHQISKQRILFSAVAMIALYQPFAAAQTSPPTTVPKAMSGEQGPVDGEVYRWNHVAVGGGGFITGLSSDASAQTFVGRSDTYGAYIWDRGSNRWLQLVTSATMPSSVLTQAGIAQGTYEIAVAPTDPNRIYLAIAGTIYRTNDRGQSWAQEASGLPQWVNWDPNNQFRMGGPFMAVSPSDPDLVLLGTPQNGLWRSTDGGASWQLATSVPNAETVVSGVLPPGIKIWFEAPAGGQPTGRVFAFSSGNGMYVSTDSGATFAPLQSYATGPANLDRGAFDRSGRFFAVDGINQTVWSYHDTNWHNLNLETGLPAKVWAGVAANPFADQVIVMDQGGVGFASSDGFQTWSDINHQQAVGPNDPPWLVTGQSSYMSTADVLFDPVTPNRLWAGLGTGVFHADTSQGTEILTWISLTRGIENMVATDIIQAPGHAPLFAGADFGLRIKQDNSWPTTFLPGQRALMSVPQMDWSPADPDFVVSNASDPRNCCAEDGNAVMAGVSLDDGQTWQKFQTLPTPPATQPGDPWRMSFGSIAVSADSTSDIVWEPAFDRQPFYTLDRGATWQPVVLGGQIGDLPGSLPYSWSTQKTLAADKVAPGTFYLVHNGDAPNQALTGLWRTTDGGATWVQVFSGMIAPGASYNSKLRAVPGMAHNLFFTADNTTVADTALRRSTDGGATWSIVPGVTHVDDIAFGAAAAGANYPAIYLSGQVQGHYGIWRSVDNTQSWQRLVDFPVASLDQVIVVAADPSLFGRVYVGFRGSGWAWGQPAGCTPAVPQGLTWQTCSRVGSAVAVTGG